MKKNLTIENIKTTEQLGLALKRLRKQKGLSQTDLSKLMNMRQPTISDIENGRGTLESFLKIVQALQINLTLTNTDQPKQRKNTKISNMLDMLGEE